MPSEFDLTRFLPYQLAVLSERASKALSPAYNRQHGLTIADWRVLVHTARAGSASVREIHRTVNLDKPRVSRSVTRLAKHGLLAKRVDAHDKRLVEISLTDHGSEILDDILPKALIFETELIGTIAPEDLEMFFDLIERLHRHLDGIDDAPGRPDPDLPAADAGRSRANMA